MGLMDDLDERAPAMPRLTGALEPRGGWQATGCSLARAIDVVSTRSAFLLLREACYGTTRFDDFAARAGISEPVAGAGAAGAAGLPADREGSRPVPGAGRADGVGRPVADRGRRPDRVPAPGLRRAGPGRAALRGRAPRRPGRPGRGAPAVRGGARLRRRGARA